MKRRLPGSVKSELLTRAGLFVAAMAVVATGLACSSPDQAAPVPSTAPATTEPPTATAAPTPEPPVPSTAPATTAPATTTAAPATTAPATTTAGPATTAPATVQTASPVAQDEPGVEGTYVAVGDPTAATVVVLAQGGPLDSLVPVGEITERLGVLNLERVLLVNVHQAQTLDTAAFAAGDITFEEAKAADSQSVAMFAAVVDHFREQGRRVYVVGISFGAFVVQELLATRGNVADGYLIAVGRIDMPDGIWTEFAEGRGAGFVRGVEIVKHTDDHTSDAPQDVFHRNSARLAAGLGHHRYSQRLARVDMANVVYLYATLDEQVGRLTGAEIEFLTGRGARIVEHDGGHDITPTVIFDALAHLVPGELLNQP